MDFLDPIKKRAHNRRLFIGYFLIGVAIIMASIILVYLSYGYDVDRKTGQVIQNGLIFTATEPDSANIYLNGKANGETDKRLTVPAGKYDVEFRRTGYRTWKKNLQLEGSSIERLVYARLFPEKLVQAESAVFAANPEFSTQSPDRRWILVGQAGSPLSFQLFDTANPEEKPLSLQLPASLLSPLPAGATQKMELVEWASDNRHVLLDHTYGDKHEFIILDRENIAASLNINKHLTLNPTKVTLRDKKFDELYIYDAPTLTLNRASTKTKLSTPLLENVLTYKTYQADIVAYAAKDAAKPGKTTVKLWDKDKSYDLRTFSDTEVLLDIARFDSEWYVAVAPRAEGRLYLYKDAFSRLKAKPSTPLAPHTSMKMTDAAFLSFSANTRFVSVQSGRKFAVYDIELNRRYSYEVPGDVAITQKAVWMDGHRLSLNQTNKVVVFDFDGTNRQELAASLPDSLPFFDRDYERLYTLTAAKDDATKTALTRTSLKLNLKP